MNSERCFEEQLLNKLDSMLEWVSCGLRETEEEKRLQVLENRNGKFLDRLYSVALENEDYEVCATIHKMQGK